MSNQLCNTNNALMSSRTCLEVEKRRLTRVGMQMSNINVDDRGLKKTPSTLQLSIITINGEKVEKDPVVVNTTYCVGSVEQRLLRILCK
jgi:hypothetical protein